MFAIGLWLRLAVAFDVRVAEHMLYYGNIRAFYLFLLCVVAMLYVSLFDAA